MRATTFFLLPEEYAQNSYILRFKSCVLHFTLGCNSSTKGLTNVLLRSSVSSGKGLKDVILLQMSLQATQPSVVGNMLLPGYGLIGPVLK
jgi:hypothetical protein